MHDSGYIHLDIKPQNFFVGGKGILKLGDFNFSRKKSRYDQDFFEGDSTYLAPEILDQNYKIEDLNERCDVFSLGISLLEILFRIELPQNGVLWKKIRSQGFKIPNEFYEHSNISNIPEDLYKLIYGMMDSEPSKRFEIPYIFENFPELKNRLKNLDRREYRNSYEKFLMNINSEMQFPKKSGSREIFL